MWHFLVSLVHRNYVGGPARNLIFGIALGPSMCPSPRALVGPSPWAVVLPFPWALSTFQIFISKEFLSGILRVIANPNY